ncbi:MAG: S8 family serine peptidase [Wenzhouxiangella sp.]
MTSVRSEKSRRLIASLALVLASGLIWINSAHAGEDWLRIDQPGPELRSSLPDAAIDYGEFVWVPAEAADASLRTGSTRVIENPFAMNFDGRSFDPADGFPDFPDDWAESGRSASGADFHLIQFQGPIKAEWLEAIRDIGLEPVQYLAPYSYIVWGETADVAGARGLNRVRFADRLPAAVRVPVQSRVAPRPHSDAMALIYRPEAERVVAAMARAGVEAGRLRASGRDLVSVRLVAAPDKFRQLADIPGVLTVQQISQDGGPRGEMSGQSVVGGIDESGNVQPGYDTWLSELGFDGDGITVAIVDSGVRETHVDLAGRFAPCQESGRTPTSCSRSDDDHGTHVAGALAGNGATGTTDANGFLRGLGMAPAARMVQQRYPAFLDGSRPGGMVPDGMLTIFHESVLSGALIANNSWGPSSTPQGYDIPTRDVDIITRDADPDTAGAQPLLPVWAIMNGSGDGFGSCAPSSLGAPDEAKNLLAVGSTALQSGNGSQVGDILDISANSAHGPACDGRRVPHLVAPGCATDSTFGNTDTAHGIMCGTSMAAPVVAGTAALFFEHYRERFGTEPSPALTKAVFTATALDLAGQLDADGNNTLDHRPDRKQGWGRLDAAAALTPKNNISLIDQTVTFTASGQSWSASYAVHRDDEPVSIRLAWSDAPGPALGGTTPAWVNDLDLVVEVDGTEYLGNDLDPTTGYSTAGGSPDGMNNLEGVVLDPSQHQGRELTITVLAANIAADALDPHQPGALRQDFALAAVNLGAPDEAVALDFATQPADVDPGQSLPQITVEVVDAFGNLAAGTEEHDIEISAEFCGSACTLSGTTTLTTSSRQADFTDLSIDTDGNYRLRASTADPMIDDVVSDWFEVGDPPLFRDRFESP